MYHEVFPTIRAILLKDPHPNGVPSSREDELQAHMDTINKIYDCLEKGERVYLGITSGERKGSIAYIQLDDDYRNERCSIRHFWDKYRFGRTGDENGMVSTLQDDFISCVLRWDGRRNKVKWVTYKHTVYLPDYEGPTVWEKFDKKAAAAENLKSRPALDRDGSELAVGDRVLYINARYGAGASLDRGTVSKIKATMQMNGDRQYTTTHVIIDNDNGQKSDIKEPQLSIIKFDG